MCYVMRKLDITSLDLPRSVYVKDSASHIEIEDILKDTYPNALPKVLCLVNPSTYSS